MKEEKQSEKIMVDKEKLDAILKKIERLESAASKAGLNRYDSINAEDKQRQVKLLTYDNKVIQSWENMPINLVEKNQNSGVWSENQQIVLNFFGEDKPMTVDYVVWSRRYGKKPAIIEEETRMLNPNDIQTYGQYKMKVKDFDGTKYVIGSKYVN
jgi:hypothetical protein